MLRYLAALLTLPCVILPTPGAADWAPRPHLFSYDATFAQCTRLPVAGDPARDCADRLAAAYALKRAVARAAQACDDTPLPDCPAPLEQEGLPAIAARIAGDIGCQATPLAQVAADTALPQDHCVSVAADIMVDEGVVPVDTAIPCGPGATECQALAAIHAALWADAVRQSAGDDPTIADLQARNAADCLAQADAAPAEDADLAAQRCLARRSAALWIDLQTKD